MVQRAAAVVALLLASVTSAPLRPNIIFVLADDLGWGNIGVHNGGVTLSPHIDALFTRGLTLNQSYVHKWCAPTRASLMTGRLPYKTGVEHGSLGTYAAPEQYLALSQDWTFLPRTLSDAGYATHMLGKWNLGFWASRYQPVGRGFDSYLGYLGPDGQYYTHFKWPPYHGGSGTPADYSADLPSFYDLKDLTNNTGRPAVNGSNVTAYQGVYSTYMYAAEARRIIGAHAAARQAAERALQAALLHAAAAAADVAPPPPAALAAAADRPFFLYMAAQSIHTPLEAPAAYVSLYPDAPNGNSTPPSDAQLVHAMVSALDDLVGNITDAVRRAGEWERTLVVFSSDNGGDTHGNNYPLRGGKVRLTSFDARPRPLPRPARPAHAPAARECLLWV